ncbi:MAG: phosphoribosylamine--glycine ligase [Candidatus Marinimicrobia bacterium]|nr:phosphoribosylamine--glycine ligase [Candidatus Neomarinimicrobiota bacterium]
MPDKRNILVLGSGGREHAIVWKLKQSLHCNKIFCIPGNGGIASLAECVNIPHEDQEALANFVRENNIALTIVGPEQPLVDGIVDNFRKKGLAIFGPDKIAAQLEGSKAFSKDFMKKYAIPTAEYLKITDISEAPKYLDTCNYPVVVKASGLAAGKGVIICENRESADQAVHAMLLNKQFGSAGEMLVIEEFLEGEEISIFVLTDGFHYHILPTARDHKRAYEGDKGPNTGGMGAFSPAPLLKNDEMEFVKSEIIEKTIKGIKKEGGDYKGIIYIGLMITSKGIKVLEYNCRFGDPEAQVILPLLENDLVELIDLSLTEKLNECTISSGDRHCAAVVLASGGYPDDYKKGLRIEGADNNYGKDVIIFHAGTKMADGKLVSSGGRVLAVTALAESKEAALDKSYAAIKDISLKDSFYRKDIGKF